MRVFQNGDIRAAAAPADSPKFYRHRLPVRIMHWVNVISFFLMLMSGLGIFNAHPYLYWGKQSNFEAPLLSIIAQPGPDGQPRGVTRIAGHSFNTDGVLGASRGRGDTGPSARAFPSWATLPGPQYLATARNWHLFFAWIFVINGIAYVAYSVVSGHLRRDLVPTGAELRTIGASVTDHLRLKHPSGDAARRYNVLQSLTYLAVIFGLLPLIVVAGMAMSPRLDTLFGIGWVDVLGGRQSARTLHFLAAAGLVGFVIVHLFEVIVTGPWNNLRSMLTGYYHLSGGQHRRKEECYRETGPCAAPLPARSRRVAWNCGAGRLRPFVRR
jgi:thiosulfate reductase cytochrome b subunit